MICKNVSKYDHVQFCGTVLGLSEKCGGVVAARMVLCYTCNT